MNFVIHLNIFFEIVFLVHWLNHDLGPTVLSKSFSSRVFSYPFSKQELVELLIYSEKKLKMKTLQDVLKNLLRNGKSWFKTTWKLYETLTHL